MAIRRPGQTIRVTGPDQRSVDVKFFADGSVRFRLNEAGPMVIRYAFLPGRGLNVVVEVTPMLGSSWVQTRRMG